MSRNRPHHDNGFTLVELLVVMLILGILSAIAFPAFAAQTRKARLAALRSTLRSAASAEEAVASDNAGAYAAPGDIDALLAQGLRQSSGVVLEILDDDMTLAGNGYCLHAYSEGHPDDELWFASSGPDSGAPTTAPCVAS